MHNTCSTVGNYYFITEKSVTFWLTFLYIYIYIYIYRERERESDVTLPYMNMGNVHRMFITYIHNIEHRNPETQKALTTSIIPPQQVWHPPQALWPGFGEQAKVTPLLRMARLNSTDLFKIPQILRARFRCMMSFTCTSQPFYLGLLFWHLWTTHPPARALTLVLKFALNWAMCWAERFSA